MLSLFNGIGGALRCYDILGLIPTGILCFDVHGPANRATAKRWSQAEILGDVRLITREMVQSWFRRFVPVSELHIWAGFPCTDLSAAKSRRLGLEGPASSLFWEVKRVGESRSSSTCHGQIYSWECRFNGQGPLWPYLSWVGSDALPYYHLNCSDSVPMQRPRLCLSSETLEGCLEGLLFTGADHWTVVEALARYAKQEQWVSPGGRSHLADCDESDQKKGSATQTCRSQEMWSCQSSQSRTLDCGWV